MTNKSLIPIGISLFALVGFTACGDTGGEVSSTNEQSEEQTAQPETTEEEPSSSERPAFGDTWTYDDGLSITITEPEEFSPGEWAAGGESHENHVTFEITIGNETGSDFDPELTDFSAHSSGAEAEAIFDADAGLNGPPATTLLDGQTTTFDFAFGVNDPSDVTMEFTDFGSEPYRDSVIFISR